MSIIAKVVQQRLYPPKPSSQKFTGKTILITAVTSGLGLEAAKQPRKLAVADTQTLIITGRTQEKIDSAKKQIEQHVATSSSGREKSRCTIVALPLEMSEPSSVQSFIDTLRTKTKHLDHAILNAGVINTTHHLSTTGYESTIQVNSISTCLLSLLLTPFLLASPSAPAPKAEDRPHLVLVSSGMAWLMHQKDVSEFMNSATVLQDFSKEEKFPPGRLGGQSQYARSKLVLEYSMRRIASLPALKDSIIVTSVCPGMVRSDLGRQYNSSLLLSIAMTVVSNTMMRRTEDGANIYISVLSRGEEVKGEMWKDDKVIGVEAEEMMRTETGKKFGDEVWKEMKGILETLDGTGVAKELLQQ